MKGKVTIGEDVVLDVDGDRRGRLRSNHSATHLLHEALRRRLGDHVTQKGSLVAPDRLRFDFSHPVALDAGTLAAIEDEVNGQIRANGGTATRLMTPEQAIAGGALALFGEKYGEEVRVVSMGRPDADNGNGGYFSTELCGGTHVRRTGDIGTFKIVAESAVASGVRRVEALTGEAALSYLGEQERLVRAVAGRFRTTPTDLEERVDALLAERRRLEREIADLRQRLAAGPAMTANEDAAREIAGVRVMTRSLEGVPGRELRPMADRMKRQLGSGIVVLVATDAAKAAMVVGVTDDLTGRFDAVELVRAGVATLGGKGGGGRSDMAQGGGPDAANAAAAIETVERRIEG